MALRWRLRRWRAARRSGQGGDVAIGAEITLAAGGQRGRRSRSSFDAIERCEHCHGNGAEPGTPIETCPKCQGAGQLRAVTRTPFGQVVRAAVCDMCDGDGTRPARSRARCAAAAGRKAQPRQVVGRRTGRDRGRAADPDQRPRPRRRARRPVRRPVRARSASRRTRGSCATATTWSRSSTSRRRWRRSARPSRCRRSTGPPSSRSQPARSPTRRFPIRGEGMPALRGRRHGNLRVVVNVVDPAQAQARAARPAPAAVRQPDRGQPAHRRGRVRQAAAGLRRLIRLAIRVRRDQAELVLAELLELAPSGVEEVDARTRVDRVRGLRCARRATRAAGAAGRGRRRAGRVATEEIADDWARALARIPPPAGARRPATRTPALGAGRPRRRSTS